jgi:hypothetical protein
MLCYAMPCHAMLCHAMLCHAMPCYAMLCYAVLCYAMLCCHAMLCHAMLGRHPNIVGLVAAWERGDAWALVLELAHGGEVSTAAAILGRCCGAGARRRPY